MKEVDAKVLTFPPKPGPAPDSGATEPSGIMADDRDVIMQTLENVMDVQERLEKGMAAHNPDAAKRVGVPVKVAREFVMADVGRKFAPAKPAKPDARKSK